MTRFLFVLAFFLGAAAVLWVGLSFQDGQPLALLATVLIALVYGFGFLELLRFRRATERLSMTLTSSPGDEQSLGGWLASLPGSLRAPVRRRIEGEPVALPGPMLTPYLSALLVMLGLLGTFVGMTVTLRGAVTALDGGSDLQAIQSSLAAPIAGLSLAFGTSIAGVASSAMLGLAAVLCRRERLLVGRELDGKISGELRPFSLKQQQRDTFHALRAQSDTFPEVAARLHALTDELRAMGDRLASTLTDNQARFHQRMSEEYQILAKSVGHDLQHHLADGVRQAAEGIGPVVEATLGRLHEQTERTHERLERITEQQLAGLGERFQASADTLLTGQRQGVDALMTRIDEHLGTLRDEEAARGAAATQRLADLEASAGRHLADLGRTLEAPMTRLIETASETPKAAAEVISRLREETVRNSERDNELLEERRRLMGELDALLDTQRQAAEAQRAAMETLINDTGITLKKVGDTVATQVERQSSRLETLTDDLAGGARDVASLGEAFGAAVTRFGESNDTLLDTLRRIETGLENSAARSDQQLAYYVEQAREVIDLSLAARKEVIDALGHPPAGTSNGAGAR